MKAKSNLIGINYPKGLQFTQKRMEILLPKKRHTSETKYGNCLIIDAMNVAHMAYHAYSKLSFKGQSTSILFGFTQILRPIMQQYTPEKIVVVWDGKKHPMRKELVPGYKLHRQKGRDPDVRRQFIRDIKKTRVLLKLMGITQVHNPEVEGDDMIYLVTKRLSKLYRCIIVSADKDFKQMINWDVDIFNPRTKVMEGVWAFSAGNYGLEVPQYLDFLCLTGDKSDDIPGYGGIGEVRGSTFLRKFYSIKNYLESKAEFPGLTDKQRLKEVYQRNLMMIGLKEFNEKYNKNADITYYKGKSNPNFNQEKYDNLCRKYNLRTMLDPKFQKPFK